MKLFEIKDENDISNKALAWLIYYEASHTFYIELPEKADPWETPLLLSTFASRGQTSVDSYWSDVWVSQRIVPTDRQNLGQILKDNGLKSYDKFALLMLTNGRCSQDSYYLSPIDRLPDELNTRLQHKIKDIIPLSEQRLLVFFQNNKVKKCDLSSYMKMHIEFTPIRTEADLFSNVAVAPGGYGVYWDDMLRIPYYYLYASGTDIPLSPDDFISFVKNRVVNGAEAAQLLNCSRQNIDDLSKRDKLHPIKTNAKNKLYLKSEIEERKNS